MCNFPEREIFFKVSQSGPIPKLEKPTRALQSQPFHHAAGERGALPGTQNPANTVQSIPVSLLTGYQCSRNSTGKRGFGGEKYRAYTKASEHAYASSSCCSEEPCYTEPQPLVHREKRDKYLAIQLKRMTFLNR